MNLLIKLFVKDYKNTNDEDVRVRYGVFAGALGIVSNLILVSIKIIFGIISFSIALIADAINNLSDALSSLMTIIGFKLAKKAPDEKHPFGHERIEYITSLLIAIVILVVGGNFLIQSIKKCINPSDIDFTLIAIIFLGVSIVIKLWQGMFYLKVSKLISSTTLKAAARDSFSDSIVTLSVLASTLIFYFSNINIDAYIGILVSLFVLYNGIKTVFESTQPLIGELPEKELVDMVIKDCLSSPHIKGYHDLYFHMYGPSKLYSSIHLEFDYKEDILVIHEEIDELEKMIYDKYKVDLVVHMDPVIYDDEQMNHYKKIITNVIDEFDSKIQIHDFRVVKGPNTTKILFDCALPVEYYNKKYDVKKTIEHKVCDTIKNVECIVVLDTFVKYE